MQKTIVIGQIGLIQKSKKQSFTIEVIKTLRNIGYDAVGVFAGECREYKYMKELEQQIKQLDLNNRVVFLGRRNDVPDMLKILDVLMIPSFEGFPLAGLEAAAAGTPVVACDVAGAKEFVEVSCAGKIYSDENVQEAAQAIISAIQIKSKLIENGINFANLMTPESYQKKIKKCFQVD